ncbi:MAG: ABC transporter substrate-binding protein [Christensenellales bacterium]
MYDILYNKYASTVNEFGYVKITRDNYEDFKTNLSVLAASALKIYIPNWYVLLTVKNVGASVYTKTLATTTYTDDEINTLVNDGQFYFSFDTPIGDNAGMRTLAQMHALTSMKKHFLNADGEDVYDILYNKYASHANEFGYIRISQRNIEDFKTNLSVISASALKAYVTNWYSLTSVLTFDEEKIGTTTFAEVGMFKTADNKFVMVFENALTQYQVKSALTSNWLVYKAYYEEGYSQHGSLKLTSYGTTSGKYMGYGPYKLDSYETDKQLIFVRNENWYGYKSDKKNYHANEYQTDRIVCKILADQATALLEFESGNLDNVVLSANDTDKYKFSDYLLKRSGSNTWSISINSDAEKLAALESDGNGNRRILSVPEFRKAISLSIDRSYIAQTVVAGATAAYTFINDNYYYDMENDRTAFTATPRRRKSGSRALRNRVRRRQEIRNSTTRTSPFPVTIPTARKGF